MIIGQNRRERTQVVPRFLRREDGGVMVLSLIFFALMVMVGGMAVDLMRYENSRTALQQTLDRSILAAASLKQVRDPRTVVEDYFQKAGILDELEDVDASPALASRVVTATGRVDVPTIFMHMLDIDSITAEAAGQAIESVSNIEISLVLDISGSMRDGDQIGKLRIAAKNFFAKVLDGDAKTTTSINVIPYAGQVNVGTKLFSKFGANRVHSNSSCIEMTAADYLNSAKPGTGRDQVPHFMKWAIAPATMDWGWCPKDKSAIIIAQNDLTKLNTYIDNIRLHDGTGTMVGVKYGLMLLDPAMRSTFADLASSGDISNDFSDRPLDWQTSIGSDVTKYMIVMTDGQHHRPVPPQVFGLPRHRHRHSRQRAGPERNQLEEEADHGQRPGHDRRDGLRGVERHGRTWTTSPRTTSQAAPTPTVRPTCRGSTRSAPWPSRMA